jgi:hypothetical protein
MKMIWFEKREKAVGYTEEPCYALAMRYHKPFDRVSFKCAVTMGTRIVHPERVVAVLEQLGFKNLSVIDLPKARMSLTNKVDSDPWDSGKNNATVVFDVINQPHSLVCLASLIARHQADNTLNIEASKAYDITTPKKFHWAADRWDNHMGSITRNSVEQVMDTWEEVGNAHRAAKNGSWMFKYFLLKDYS